MENVVYTKYSNERAKEFQIRTSIIYDNMEKKKFVCKSPLTEEAEKHIENMNNNYKLLSEKYKKENLQFVKCKKINDELRFEYIEGKTFEQELDELLLNDKYDELIVKINEYVNRISSISNVDMFLETREFEDVFGKTNLPSNIKACSVSNIDMIFNNIIINDKWNVIDYEWTFNFSIPINYIIFRALNYYIYTSTKRIRLVELNLYRIFGISDLELEQYKTMENNFQKYILNNIVPLRELYASKLNDNINIFDVIEKDSVEKSLKSMQIFFDYGNGINERDSYNILLNEIKNGENEIEIPLDSEIKKVRIDPCNSQCLLKLELLEGRNPEKCDIIYNSNGLHLCDDIMFFQTNDPQIIIDNIDKKCTKIILKFRIEYILNDFTNVIYNKLPEIAEKLEINLEMLKDKENIIEEKEKTVKNINNELNNYKQHYEAAISQRDTLNRKVRELESSYNIIINSASWKITKPIRVILDFIKKFLKLNKHILLVCKGLKCLKQNGFKYTIKKIRQRSSNAKGYNEYAKQMILSEKERKEQSTTEFPRNIKFSIVVPLYNTPEKFLCEMINSCIDQTYINWELCLADGSDSQHEYVGKIVNDYIKKDKRIKYKKLIKNGGISENTNESIQMSSGDYIALFDHDDLLHPSALFEYMKAICYKNADFIYCDELTFEGSLDKVITMHFKPDFAIDNLRANNYICHFTVFNSHLLKETGLFRKEYDGSQDHDMILRLTEKAKKIVHIPQILYYWRSHPKSVAADINSKTYAIDAGKRAVRDHLSRCGLNAIVDSSKAFPTIYRIKYDIKINPKVSIIIPNKDNKEILERCINSILDKSTYKNIEIIIVENNSSKAGIFEYYKDLKKHSNIKVVVYDEQKEFNYSAINNFGVWYATGEQLLFLNNDIEIITPNWIEEMLMYSQRDDVGAVGAKLYYPDNTVQHAGIILKLGAHRCAGHCHYRCEKENLGYMGRLHYAQDFSAVTAACLMMKKKIFEEINGFDEFFKVAFNDVDLCMRIRKRGYLIAWTPYAEAYHYESISRGYEDTAEKQRRFEEEANSFKIKWKKELENSDPYYNVNFTLDRSDFSLK